VGVVCSTIASGGSVVCSPGFQDEHFACWMSELEPTWYSAVPTIHQSVLALAREIPALARAAPLRLIRASSSSLPPTVMQKLETVFQVPVIESYGMTEAAHQMASNPLPARSATAQVEWCADSAIDTESQAAERKPGSVGLPAGPNSRECAGCRSGSTAGCAGGRRTRHGGPQPTPGRLERNVGLR